MSIHLNNNRLVAIGTIGLVLTAGSTWLTLTSENISVSVWAAAGIRATLIMAPIAVGLYALSRRQSRRFATILIVWGFAFFPVTLNASASPFVYTAATMWTALPYAFILSVYLLLAFPHGRLETRSARAITGGSLVVGATWIIGMMVSETPPTMDWFVRCGEACPDNVAFVLDNPELADVVAVVSRIGTAAVTLAIAITFGHRLYRASRPMLRTLLPVAVIYIATAVAATVYRFAENANVGADTLNRLAITLGVTRALVPFGILAGMISARVFVSTALVRLMRRLDGDSGSDQVQGVLAEALGDPLLTIGYWLPDRQEFVDSHGQAIERPEAGSEQVSTEVERGGVLVAVIIHDPALTEVPGVVEAGASAALLALENARYDAELQASIIDLQTSRARIVTAADDERRRVERDLHDGAQARLVALRIDLELLGDLVDEDPQRTREGLKDLGEQVDDALDELRRLAHGIYPPLLEDHGLDDALQSVALRAPVPTQVDAGDIGRYRTEVESAVYFCCLEALQNVSKHGGTGTIATIRIWDADSDLHFQVGDNGTGFDPAMEREGIGFRNMRDRLGAVGGNIDVASALGKGTVVSGRVPTTSGHPEVPTR